MLSNPNNWCLITTYKENYSMLPHFVMYYKRRFGIRKMLLFCGLTNGNTHEKLKHLIAEKLDLELPLSKSNSLTCHQREITLSIFNENDMEIHVASYQTEKYTNEKDFHNLRLELYRWSDEYLNEEITRTLVVDNDEFLHVKDPAYIENIDKLGFHFLDIIPSPSWPPRELKFSLQGWYYRRQARPIFKNGGKLALFIAKKTRRLLDHGSCKTFCFDRKHLGDFTPWHHGTSDSLCSCHGIDRHFNNPSKCGEILRETACCYHLAMTTMEHFMNERLQLFSRIQTDMEKKPENGENDGYSPETKDQEKAIKTYNKYIKESIFPVLTDNFLMPYINDENT